MRRTHRNRHVNFDVVDEVLEHTVSFDDGHSYTHRCSPDTFREVAHALDATGRKGATMEEIARSIDAPFTQANVAFEFMKERGCIVTRSRRSYPASACLFEDAMCEFTFLAELPH